MPKKKKNDKSLQAVAKVVSQQPVENIITTPVVHIPLYVYAVTLASLCIIVGLRWDVSWHGSVGRDTFFTPPHILVYAGAVIGGMFSGIQLLWNSFAVTADAKKKLVKIWGLFYTQYGALFCIWGALAMLTSAPFDNWWHNTYGLDITFLSPPHTVLGLGMLFLQLGACISISKHLNDIEKNVGANNCLQQQQKKILRVLFIIAAASLLSMVSIWIMDYTDKRSQRAASFYEIMVIDILLFLPAFGRQLRMKYGMTIIAIAYFFITAITNWVMQMVPATPKLGPVLNRITHLQSLPFPFLLFVPAFVMDMILLKTKSNDWIKATLISIVFVILLFAVQYPLSGFLVASPLARNWFFGGDAWPYNAPPDWEYRYQLQQGEESTAPELFIGIIIAIVIGFLVSGISLRWGKWMQGIEK